MVCIPCIVIPFCLWVFHRFIRPVLLKIWNPWAKQNKISVGISAGEKSSSSTESKVGNGKISNRDTTNPIAGSEKISTSKSVNGTKVCEDSALQEERVTDKKRD